MHILSSVSKLLQKEEWTGMEESMVHEALQQKVRDEPYAQKLDIRLVSVAEGYSLVEMKVTEEMQNIFGMPHGGAVFSLVDEAFEIASNSHGTVALALNMSITYTAAATTGDTLRAEAKEVARSSRTATYDIRVTNDNEVLIAVCQALVYRKADRLPFLDQE